VNEFNVIFVFSLRKLTMAGCPTIKHDTVEISQNSANSFEF